jgi:uncharacterized damage-inducible protein DinB
MHRALESHAASLGLNTSLFLNCLDRLTEEEAQNRHGGEGNSISFIAAHLIDARFFLARTLGADVTNPFGKDLEGVNSIDDVEQLPELSFLRQAWTDVSQRLLEQASGLSDEELWAVSSQKFPIEDDTTLGAFTFLLHHESYHIGQMGLLRRQLGYPAMTYAEQPDSGGGSQS